MSVQGVEAPSDPAAIRESFIAARIDEFKADPDVRDRAIATILYDVLTLNQMVMHGVNSLNTLGPAGILKAIVGGKRG